MLLFESLAPADSVAGDRLVLAFETRCKSRLRARLASGAECGLFLPRGTVMRGGDKLLSSDGRIAEVVAAVEPLMEAASEDPQQLARAAYHLGNRRVAVQILADRLRFVRDRVLGEMLRGLGLAVVEIEAAFEPEPGAYGAHGANGHSGEGELAKTRPKIHDHFQGR